MVIAQRSPMRWLPALLLVLALLPAGKVFAWEPPMKVEQSILGNVIVYRDGEQQPYWAMTGYKLDRAFEGSPRAVALAKQYQFWSTVGLASTAVGNALFLGGVYYRLAHEYRRNDHPASWAFVISGGLLSMGGSFINMNSKRLIFQAVNAFNEDYDPQQIPKLRIEAGWEAAPEGRLVLDFPLGGIR